MYIAWFGWFGWDEKLVLSLHNSTDCEALSNFTMKLRNQDGNSFLSSLSFSILILCLNLLPQVSSVRNGDFKQCKDSSFCRRTRRLSHYVEEKTTPDNQFQSPYSIPSDSSANPSFHAENSTLVYPLTSALHPHVQFQLQFIFHDDGTSRVKLDEIGQKHSGWKRYDEAQMWGIENQPKTEEQGKVDWNFHQHKGQTVVR